MDEWDAKVSAALKAFERFVSNTPDDDAVVDHMSGLTGAQLHIAQRTLEDMAVDYDVVLGSRAVAG